MKAFERLLLENKAWAREQVDRDPQFFRKISQERVTEVFWIGCSDSRVHAAEITHSNPGTMFVHRNVGNLVVATDMNLLSALEYAVDILKVKHVIVCGHYECGGIRTAMGKTRPNELIINKWLKHIRDIYRLHRAEIDRTDSEEGRAERLVELNVIEQVQNLAQLSIIQNAWNEERRPELHGWVYGLQDGVIKELITLDCNSSLEHL